MRARRVHLKCAELLSPLVACKQLALQGVSARRRGSMAADSRADEEAADDDEGLGQVETRVAQYMHVKTDD